MKDHNWTYVFEDNTLLESQMKPSYPMGVNVVLARVEGVVYAISGMCAHMSCPLFTGMLEGYIITCPCHDWRFDIRTGKFLDAPELGLVTYSTKLENGKLYVFIN